MQPGPITNLCLPTESCESGKWVVKALSRDAMGKLRADLEEYFSHAQQARNFFDELLKGDDLDDGAILLIAHVTFDKWGDESLGEMLRLQGSSLKEARKIVRMGETQGVPA